MTLLFRIEKWIDIIVSRLIQILLLLTVIIVSLQVALRYLFSFTPSWSEEITLVFIIWVSFIGIAYGFRENLHISVELVASRFPETWQKGLDWLTRLMVLVVGGLFLYFGTQFTILMSHTTMPGTHLPLATLYFCVPVSGLLMILYTITGVMKTGDPAEMKEGMD